MDAPRCPGLGQIEPAAHALSLLERWGQTRAGSVLTCHWKLALAVASRLSLGPEQPQPLAETTYALRRAWRTPKQALKSWSIFSFQFPPTRAQALS